MAGFNLDLESLNLGEAPRGQALTKEFYANKPICVLVIGMAGSGKSSLMQRINLEMIEKNKRAYYINLDPATSSANDLPFAANIDIRDTVQYKEVMKQYGLGPNGAILTSLNLFATRFDQVIRLIEKRVQESSKKDVEDLSPTDEQEPVSPEIDKPLDYVFIDTPGQIEVFTWSAGGQIIHEVGYCNAFERSRKCMSFIHSFILSSHYFILCTPINFSYWRLLFQQSSFM